MSEDPPDTDPSELEPMEPLRDTKPPPSLEAQIAELQGALAESNALSILSRNASERCTDKVTALMARLIEGDAKFREHDRELANVKHRLEMLELHVGLAP